MKHKHYDCIVAWAEGKKIEFRINKNFTWEELEEPLWNNDFEYRIKKEPVIEVKYYAHNSTSPFIEVNPAYLGWNLKITYQDGKAIKAEVAE